MTKNVKTRSLPAQSFDAKSTLLGAAAILFLIQAWNTLLWWTYAWDYHGVRLGRAFVLRSGEPLFPGASSGAVSTPIYGPVSAILYLPATFAERPATALVIAQLLAAFCFFAPVAWLTFRSARRLGRAVDAFLLFAASVFAVKALEYVAFNIHTDAPALGLSFLACAALILPSSSGDQEEGVERQGWRRSVLSALFCVLALWTKQMTLALPPALLLWTWRCRGRGAALRLLAALAGCGTVSLGFMVLFFGPAENLWLNLWTIPSGHTPEMQGGTVAALSRASLRFLEQLIAPLLLWGLALILTRRREMLLFFGWTALCQVPLAMLGFLKKAGDINAFAYVIYFLVAGAALALASDEDGPRPELRRLLTAVPICFFFGATLVGLMGTEPWPQRLDPQRVPAEHAYDFMQEHPGEFYFPRLSWVSAMAEEEIYHQGIGVMDRAFGGVPVTGEHLRAHLPPRMRGIVMAHNGFEDEIRYFAEFGLSCPVVLPELPGFDVWWINSLGADAKKPFTIDEGLCGVGRD